MRNRAVGALVLAFLLGSAIVSQPAQAEEAGASSVDRTSFLFGITGQGTSIEPIQDTDSYRVRISGTNNTVTWFSDRPVRESGTTTANLFMDLWSDSSFVSDPPNSALVLRDGPASGTVVVKASRPKFENGILAFTVTPLESKSALPAQVESVSLFIDNFTSAGNSELIACLKNPSAAGCPPEGVPDHAPIMN